jgi:hypothetical protein
MTDAELAEIQAMRDGVGLSFQQGLQRSDTICAQTAEPPAPGAEIEAESPSHGTSESQPRKPVLGY